jgi:hypothetical protein
LRGNRELTVDDELDIYRDISSIMKDGHWKTDDEQLEDLG